MLKRSTLSPLEIKSLHIHPFYNNSEGTHYDNDIALIKLEKPIPYNGDVMPLCLPSKEAEIRLGSTG